MSDKFILATITNSRAEAWAGGGGGGSLAQALGVSDL